jgi:hypothetical protein
MGDEKKNTEFWGVWHFILPASALAFFFGCFSRPNPFGPYFKPSDGVFRFMFIIEHPYIA